MESEMEAITEETGLDMFRRFIPGFGIYSTGLSSLDQLLSGGFYACKMTELVGPEACAKTQICYSTLATLLLNNSGEKRALYIDSNVSFRSDRLMELMKVRRPEMTNEMLNGILERLIVQRASDEETLNAALENARTTYTDGQLTLVIIDSIDACLGDSALQQFKGGQDKMESTIKNLHGLIEETGCALVVINHFTYWKSGEPEPALGQQWRMVPDTRIELSKTSIGQYNASQEGPWETKFHAKLVLWKGKTGRKSFHFELQRVDWKIVNRVISNKSRIYT